MELSQEEADRFRHMPKDFDSVGAIDLSNIGVGLVLPAMSHDQKERFLIDIWQAKIKLSKWRHQERVRKTIPLMRLEIDGSPHINRNVSQEDIERVRTEYGWPFVPELEGSHIHVYIENYGDRWAFPVSIFPDIQKAIDSQPINYARIIAAFLKECNFSQKLSFVQGINL